MAYIQLSDIKLFVNDIDKYYSPADIGNVDLLIAEGESDVIRYFENKWFINAVADYYGNFNQTNMFSGGIVPDMDITLLNTSSMKNLFIYKVLGWYICPSLMKTSDTSVDSFAAKGEYFRAEYESELNKILSIPLYDFNKDSNFTNIDKTQSSMNTRGGKVRRE